jgi:mannan endo-1,4-beta-mannosidase
VADGHLCHAGRVARPVGANAMHVFGGTSADMVGWKLGLVREFIGNLKETPLDGPWAIQDKQGSWLHPLRKIVDDNRANGLVTVLSPMGWDGVTPLFGKSPGKADFLNEYEARQEALARTFAGERDVWIELWNEPYDWTGAGFSADDWLADMQRLVDAVRRSGNDSIVVVPGSHMGQGTDVWLTHGARLKDPANGLLFDLHAYERWLLDRTPGQAAEALDRIDESGLAWMVGEVAPMNAGTLMDPRPFLSLPQVSARPVAAWLWKRSDTDPDALLTSTGGPHDAGNHAWGSSFRQYASER